MTVWNITLASSGKFAMYKTDWPLMDVAIVGQSVLYMANLPLEANVMFHTVMATKMPFAGRG